MPQAPADKAELHPGVLQQQQFKANMALASEQLSVLKQ